MKALVVYGTRWGGTVSVAKKIGDTLKEANYAVAVVDAKTKPPTVDHYDLVVVGSGLRADKWTKETLRFLKDNTHALSKKKTALFVRRSISTASRGTKSSSSIPDPRTGPWKSPRNTV